MSRRDTRRLDAQQARVRRLLAKVQAGGIYDAKTPDELYKQVTTQAHQMRREGRLRADELRDILAFNKNVQRDQALREMVAASEAARQKAVRDAEERMAVTP